MATDLTMRCFGSAILGATFVLAGCNNGDPAPAPVCQVGAPTFPKPFGYGFFTDHNWACDANPAPISTMAYYVNSFIGVFQLPDSDEFHQTDIDLAADELENDVILPARDAWLAGGSSATSFPYSIDLGPVPAVIENGHSEVAALHGRMTGAAHLDGAAALAVRYFRTANPNLTVECDIYFFEEGPTKKIYWQRGVKQTPPTPDGFGPTYSWALAHELGHCLGLADQIEEWQGQVNTNKDSVMWFEASKNWMADTTNTDRAAVKHLYGP